jgi:hypothetical protein
VLEKCAMRGLVLPVTRDMPPQRLECGVGQRRSSSINRFVTAKYSFLPYGSFRM